MPENPTKDLEDLFPEGFNRDEDPSNKPPDSQGDTQSDDGWGSDTSSTEASSSVTPAPPPPNIPTPNYPPPYTVQNPQSWPPVATPDDLFELRLWPDMWPSDQGFLKSYMDWSLKTTDAPEPVHLVSILCALAAAVGGRWLVDYVGGLMLNIFVLVIADSASRKSTAMARALTLLPKERCSRAKLGSTLALVKLLKKRPTVMWYQDEADTLIAGLRNQGPTADLASQMVQAYNGGPLEYESKGEGNILVPTTCLTLLTGSALEWLQERGLTPEFLRGGLFARFMVVPAKRDRENLIPPQPDSRTQSAMAQWLKDLSKSGPFVVEISPEATDLLAAYQEGRGASPTPQLSSIWNRAPAHIVKLALLFHISLYRGGDEPIQADCMEWAINFMHGYVLPGHRWVMERLERTKDPVQDTELRIMRELESAGAKGTKLASLYGGFGARYKVKDALANLHDRGKLSFWSVPRGGPGRPTTYVVLGTDPPSGRNRAKPTQPAFVSKMQDEEGLNDEPDAFSEFEATEAVGDDDTFDPDAAFEPDADGGDEDVQ